MRLARRRRAADEQLEHVARQGGRDGGERVDARVGADEEEEVSRLEILAERALDLGRRRLAEARDVGLDEVEAVRALRAAERPRLLARRERGAQRLGPDRRLARDARGGRAPAVAEDASFDPRRELERVDVLEYSRSSWPRRSSSRTNMCVGVGSAFPSTSPPRGRTAASGR